VKRFLPDTSCLVAAVCSWHEHHARTVAELNRRARSEQIVMAAPVLAETYSVLTRLPPPYRLRPADALGAMEGSWADVEVASLDGEETWSLLRGLPGAAIAGGGTYDALIAACARKARAEAILTWNFADFERVAGGILVETPRA
jgi:predicted nucleic acid-binding protein